MHRERCGKNASAVNDNVISNLSEKKTIFSSRRNVDKNVAVRTDVGKQFHVLEAAKGKARSPKVDLRVDATMSVITSDERRR